MPQWQKQERAYEKAIALQTTLGIMGYGAMALGTTLGIMGYEGIALGSTTGIMGCGAGFVVTATLVDL